MTNQNSNFPFPSDRFSESELVQLQAQMEAEVQRRLSQVLNEVFLFRAELAVRWRLSYKALANWNSDPDAVIRPRKIGGRVRYALSDIQAVEQAASQCPDKGGE